MAVDSDRTFASAAVQRLRGGNPLQCTATRPCRHRDHDDAIMAFDRPNRLSAPAFELIVKHPLVDWWLGSEPGDVTTRSSSSFSLADQPRAGFQCEAEALPAQWEVDDVPRHLRRRPNGVTFAECLMNVEAEIEALPPELIEGCITDDEPTDLETFGIGDAFAERHVYASLRRNLPT